METIPQLANAFSPPGTVQSTLQVFSWRPSSAISPSEVSTLDHEVLDYTMEFAVFVAKSFLEKGEEVA